MIRNFISKLYSLYTPSFFMSGGGSPSGYLIERSLRFNKTNTQFLNKTLAVSNRKKFTFSAWVKRGSLGSIQGLFQGYIDTNNAFRIDFDAADTIFLGNTAAGVSTVITSTAKFRDCSAWMHVLVAVDTTQVTSTDRWKLYINGVLQTVTGSYPTLNLDLLANYNITHYVGNDGTAAARSFDGYMSEVNFVDGQALTPSDFGEINPTTGQWVAKAYTGGYGTNGFYLDFKDGTSTTTLGYDAFGSNDWTLTSFTRSAGVNDCWMLDVPAGNGSASAVQPSGNYAVLNPLDVSAATMTYANLRIVTTGGKRATIKPNLSELIYVEATALSSTNAGIAAAIGLMADDVSLTSNVYALANTWAFYSSNASYINRNGTPSAAIASGIVVAGDVLQLAYDPANNRAWFGKNNVWTGTSTASDGDPSNRLNATVSGLVSGLHIFGQVESNSLDFNFGQRSFAYTPPTGFKALCTANLTSTDVIESGSFTGNASADGSFIWLNGTPETLTINGNAVTWGTHADRLSNGFKLRTSSSSYNSSGTNTWTATILSPESKSAFKHQNAKGN